MNREAAKRTLDTLYGEVFNRGRADLMSELVSGPYIQHNPLFPNGIEALVGYLKQAGSLPNEVKRMAFEGNLAFVHVRYPNWAGKEHAAVDIFRFDEVGKIVEHWDVMQEVPATTASGNGMF
ncbi:MAG: nuclear transport factor 2 family protein [Candidatus Methylomirabilis sp.]